VGEGEKQGAALLDPDALVKLAHEAKDRAEAATEGPWLARENPPVYVAPGHDPGAPGWGIDASVPLLDAAGEFSESDATFVAHGRTDVPTLADGVIALAEENAHLHALLLRKAQPTFGPFKQTKDGIVELPVEDAMGIVRRVIDSLVTTLGNAKNYVAISGYHPAAGKVECIVQRVGRLSPHEARVEAEQHLARAIKLLAEHGIPWDGPTTFLPSLPWDRGAEMESEHPWTRIDVRTDPNAMICERCGGRQEMPRGTADVINGLLAAFGESHKDCREGDAAKMGRGAPESEAPGG
jgi:hypothetical protein